MLFRRAVVEKLGGYDESLSYEDFDFWVRSSRYFRYIYSAEPMVRKRILHGSHGSARLNKKNAHILSTARVCEKALLLNRTNAEHTALARRCLYELKWALIAEHWLAAKKLLAILKQLDKRNFYYHMGKAAVLLKPPIHPLAFLYSKFIHQ
jgi:hypothetical protein